MEKRESNREDLNGRDATVIDGVVIDGELLHDAAVGALSGIPHGADEADEGKRLGRPSTYDPVYLDMAVEYFSKLHKDEESGAIRVPSRVFFARHIGQPHTTVKHWEKLYPEFGEAIADGIEHAKELRIMLAENKLLDGAFSKFVLASAYGMSEKTAVELSGAENGKFEVNIHVVRD
ncbi:MAG: hypothetical protein E7590_00940 [Ruminococcaceae bacterium]|nr:hypothetical protein [Oscillospiraceae bacterium]